MFRFKFTYLTIAICMVFFAAPANAQTAVDNWPFPDRGDRKREEESKMVKDMLAKQQSEREKKEYRTMLERGEEALALSSSLEKTFAKNESLSPTDAKRLEHLEKLVVKIRDDLGGDDDIDGEQVPAEARPKDLREGFIVLKNSTQKLVGELKKTTRYSISIVAIESSNAVIRLARFLRLRN